MGNTSGNCQSREGLLNSAPCSVLISRGRGRGAPQERARGPRVLLALDESEHALAVARLLQTLNVPSTSQVTVLHVVDLPDDRVLHLLTTMAPKFREADVSLKERADGLG